MAGSSYRLLGEGWRTHYILYMPNHKRTVPLTITYHVHLCAYTQTRSPHHLSRNPCCCVHAPCLGFAKSWKQDISELKFPLPRIDSLNLSWAHRPALQSVVAVGQVPARELPDLTAWHPVLCLPGFALMMARVTCPYPITLNPKTGEIVETDICTRPKIWLVFIRTMPVEVDTERH